MKANWITTLILVALVLFGLAFFKGNYETRIRKFEAEKAEFQEVIKQKNKALQENEDKLIALNRQYRGLEQINEGLEAEIAQLPRVIIRTQEIPVVPPEIVDGNLPDQMLSHFDELKDQVPETLPKYVFPSKEYGENLLALLWYAYNQERYTGDQFREFARERFQLYERKIGNLQMRVKGLESDLEKEIKRKAFNIAVGPGAQVGLIQLDPLALKMDYSIGLQVTWVWHRIRL